MIPRFRAKEEILVFPRFQREPGKFFSVNSQGYWCDIFLTTTNRE